MKSQIQKKKKKKELWNCGITNTNIFPKKGAHEGANFFGQKKYGAVVLNWRTNDQIMPRFGRSFINDKCIFRQVYPPNTKSSLED